MRPGLVLLSACALLSLQRSCCIFPAPTQHPPTQEYVHSHEPLLLHTQTPGWKDGAGLPGVALPASPDILLYCAGAGSYSAGFSLLPPLLPFPVLPVSPLDNLPLSGRSLCMFWGQG